MVRVRSKTWLLVLLMLLLSGVTTADPVHRPGNFNPLVPGYFADPTVKRFGDTYYMYATTDGTNTGRAPASVWTSRDFVNWTYHTLNWPVTEVVWAPEVIRNPHDGRYYYYYSQPCRIYGGVADSPLGPFQPLTPDGLVVENYLIDDVMTLDGQILKDDDGSMYMFWGTWGVFENHGVGIGKWNPDMKSFAELRAVRNTDAREFFEAPEPVKHEGVYYLTYSSGSCHDHTYRVQYAVSTEGPYGPYRFAENNPILATTEDQTVHGPGHHCILEVDGKHYIIYHRHDLPNSAGGMFRQVAADVLRFGPHHTIERVQPTHAGVGYLGENRNPFPNLARGAAVSASSWNRDVFQPEFAVDDNFATQWRARTNCLPAWLEVDLGAVQSIARTHTHFEYAHWFYRYRIEHSLDGQHWQMFADRQENVAYGSPMVDYGQVRARYLRLTITGVERPGMCPAGQPQRPHANGLGLSAVAGGRGVERRRLAAAGGRFRGRGLAMVRFHVPGAGSLRARRPRVPGPDRFARQPDSADRARSACGRRFPRRPARFRYRPGCPDTRLGLDDRTAGDRRR